MPEKPVPKTIQEQVARDLDPLVRASIAKQEARQRKEAANAAAEAKIIARAQRDKMFIKKHWLKGAGLTVIAGVAVLLSAKSCTDERATEANVPNTKVPSTSMIQEISTLSELPVSPTITSIQPPAPEVDRSPTVSIHNAWGIERDEYTCDQLIGSVGLTCDRETQAWFNESTDEIKDFTARREYDVIAAMPWGNEPTDRAAVAIVACSEFMNGATEQQAGTVITELWDIPEFNADRLAYLSLTKVCPQFQ